MKKILILFSLILSSVAFAKLPSNNNSKTGIVSGKIIDANSKQELPYVTIIVKNAINQIATGGITDENGNFEIKQLTEGKNNIEIQFIGYKTEIKQIIISKTASKINLGTISLTEDVSKLN